jgi:hypothetical protein
VAGAGNVGAASPIPAAFVNVTVSPDYITYGHTTLTVTGRLVESADHNAGVPAEFVDINSVSTGIAIGTATTDFTGRFSVTESTLVWADQRRLPGGRWTPVMQMQAGPSGGSVLTFAQDGLFLNGGRGIAPGRYEWRAQQQYSDDFSVYYAVFRASAPVYLVTTVVDNTCVTGLTVGHANGRTQVGGEVQDSCGPGEASFGPVRGTYDVYFHPRGTTNWRLLGSARSGNGSLSFTRAGTLNGYFKVVFPAQWYYLGSTSRSVYVG